MGSPSNLKHAPISLKQVIDTRWSAHHAAVKSLQAGFDGIMDVLEELCNPNENLNTRGRGDAHSILEAIQNFSFPCYVFGKQSCENRTILKLTSSKKDCC